METKQNLLMAPSLRAGGLVPVDWVRVTRRLQQSQRQIDRARRRADRIERILYKSFTATVWLWVEQGGKCPCCGKPLTWRTGWSKHHIVPKSQGGTDALVNLQLLHPECHRKLHNEQAEDIREARNLCTSLSSCLTRLGEIPPDIHDDLDGIRSWLNCQVQSGLVEPERREAA